MLLNLFIHHVEVQELFFAFAFDAEFQILPELFVQLLGFADVNDFRVAIFADWFEVQNIVFGDVGPGADVQNFVFFVFVQRSDFDLVTTGLQVEFELDFHREDHLEVSVVSGDVAHVIERSNETDFSLAASGVSHFDFGGGLDGFALSGELKLKFSVQSRSR